MFGNAVSDGMDGIVGMGCMLGMPAMLEAAGGLGIAEGVSGGRGWPGGGIVSPASAAYGPTCGAIDEAAGCWGWGDDGVAAMAAGVDCGAGVLPYTTGAWACADSICCDAPAGPPVPVIT